MGGASRRGFSRRLLFRWPEPWNATREEFLGAVQKLNGVSDPGERSRLLGELSVWCSLNYNEIELEEIRAEMRMTLKDLMLSSPAGEELAREKWLEGQRDGRQEGRREGQLEQARHDLLVAAARLFPGRLDPAIVERIGDNGKLRAIFEALFAAPDWDTFETALTRIAGKAS